MNQGNNQESWKKEHTFSIPINPFMEPQNKQIEDHREDFIHFWLVKSLVSSSVIEQNQEI